MMPSKRIFRLLIDSSMIVQPSESLDLNLAPLSSRYLTICRYSWSLLLSLAARWIGRLPLQSGSSNFSGVILPASKWSIIESKSFWNISFGRSQYFSLGLWPSIGSSKTSSLKYTSHTEVSLIFSLPASELSSSSTSDEKSKTNFFFLLSLLRVAVWLCSFANLTFFLPFFFL